VLYVYAEIVIMSKRGQISNFEQHDVPAARYTADKSEQNHMLSSTTYGLNFSYTKKIHVGLQTSIDDEDFDFQPCVKLTAKGAEGICLNMAEWQRFRENMSHMTEYLNGDD